MLSTFFRRGRPSDTGSVQYWRRAGGRRPFSAAMPARRTALTVCAKPSRRSTCRRSSSTLTSSSRVSVVRTHRRIMEWLSRQSGWQRPRAGMSTVEDRGVAGKQPLHEGGQPPGTRAREDVDTTGHQRPRTELATGDGQKRAEPRRRLRARVTTSRQRQLWWPAANLRKGLRDARPEPRRPHP